jgi:hypothetical protein
MQWYPLTNRDASLLLAVFILSGLFNLLQPFFISPGVRPFAYAVVVSLLLLGFFCLVKPDQPMELGKFLAVLLGGIVGLIIFFRDILIRQNFSLTLVLFFAGAILCPLIVAFLYKIGRSFFPAR